MKWFKHFSQASESDGLQGLLDEFGLEGYARYWLLIELFCEKWEPDTEPKFTIHESQIRKKLRINSTNTELFLNYCQTYLGLFYKKTEKFYSFEFPKLLEILHRDVKRARTMRAQCAHKPRLDIDTDKDLKEINKEKCKEEIKQGDIISEFDEHPDVQMFFQNCGISEKTQRNLINIYKNVDFIVHEMYALMNWLEVNSHKKSKTARGYSKRISNWLKSAQKWSGDNSRMGDANKSNSGAFSSQSRRVLSDINTESENIVSAIHNAVINYGYHNFAEVRQDFGDDHTALKVIKKFGGWSSMCRGDFSNTFFRNSVKKMAISIIEAG